MAITWGSKAGQECVEGVKRNIGEAIDKTAAAIDRGKVPCAKTTSGEHTWRRRPSFIPGYGWDECSACKAERF